MQTPARRSIPARIFFSPNERRLRAGWRLLAHSMLLTLLTTCIGLPILFWGDFFNITETLLLAQVISLFGVTLSVFLARRFIDQRSMASLGVRFNRQAGLNLLAGLVMAFVMIALLAALMQTAGWIAPDGFAWRISADAWDDVAVWLAIFIITGWNEELLSRGYHLQNLRDGLNNLPAAALLSSAVFGLAHLFNPNASWVAAANITLAGLFFAFSWWRTQSLWLPIGLHIGWNFTLGVVFGFPVSGLDTFRLANPTISGPHVWTGGAFGPEAGLVIVPILIVGAVLVYAYTHRKLYPMFK